jgi:hypothetical protein
MHKALGSCHKKKVEKERETEDKLQAWSLEEFQGTAES